METKTWRSERRATIARLTVHWWAVNIRQRFLCTFLGREAGWPSKIKRQGVLVEVYFSLRFSLFQFAVKNGICMAAASRRSCRYLPALGIVCVEGSSCQFSTINTVSPTVALYEFREFLRYRSC